MILIKYSIQNAETFFVASQSLIVNVSRSRHLYSDWNENQKIPSNRRTKVELRKCQFSPPGAQFYLQSGRDCSHGTETGNRKNTGYLPWVCCDQNWCEDCKIVISDQGIRIKTMKSSRNSDVYRSVCVALTCQEPLFPPKIETMDVR